MEGAGGGGGGGCVTVSRADASSVPPAPLAVKWYVVDSFGDTVWEPFAGTAPMPSMETSVAFVVCQASEADPPAWMLLGLTDIEAVGAGGGGGGGGGAGATFFLQAPNIRIVLKPNIIPKSLTKYRFILMTSPVGSTKSTVHRCGYRPFHARFLSLAHSFVLCLRFAGVHLQNEMRARTAADNAFFE